MRSLIILIIGISLYACSPSNTIEQEVRLNMSADTIAEEVIEEVKANPESTLESDSIIETVPSKVLNDTSFANLYEFTDQISLDFRYADTNNFLNEKVYDCASCVLRREVLKALVSVNNSLHHLGYRLRLFDCYRPLSVQFKMWEIYSNASYVANPHKKGSIHNRGGAVDITLETLEGEQVDMGTDFDHFGKEAHIDYYNLSDRILGNRKTLQTAMRRGGFTTIRSEWWHFNYKNSSTYTTSNFPITCD